MLRDTVVQADERRDFPLRALHRVRECIAQPFDQLEHRQVRVGECAARDEAAVVRILFEHAFEIAEEFRQPVREEVGRAFGGFRLLLFVDSPLPIG